MGHYYIMGYYYRDLFPKEVAARDARSQRIRDLKEQLERIPLGEFNAGDLPAILHLLDRRHHSDPSDEDLERLEQKINDLAIGP